MANRYFNKPIPVIDGDIVFAEDVNIGNRRCDAAFDLVEAEIDGMSGLVSSEVEKAREWAEEPEDTLGPHTGGYSALHYSAKSSGYATDANGYAVDASGWATAAQDSADQAGHERELAETAAAASQASADDAEAAAALLTPFTETFDNSDLVDDRLAITHALGRLPTCVSIYNPAGTMVEGIITATTTRISINFGGTIQGSPWTLTAF